MFEFDTYGLIYAKAGTGAHLPKEVESEGVLKKYKEVEK